MVESWRSLWPVAVLALALGSFMALDKTVLHWYVPDSEGVAARAGNSVTGSDATLLDLAVEQRAALRVVQGSEARAIALAWVSQNFGSLDGYDCAEPELNESESRWVTVCTERADENPGVKVVSVDAVTGVAEELVSQ